MAAFLPDAKTLKCVVSIADSDGHTDQCRFFLTYSGSAPLDADLTAMAEVGAGAVGTYVMPLCREDKTNVGMIITDLTSETSAQGEGTDTAVGSLTGGSLPASAAVVIAQTTARRFRGGHSRVYLPCGDDTKLANDHAWDGAFLDSVVGAWDSTISVTASGSWGDAGTVTQVMASFYLGFTNVPYGVPTKYRRVPTPRDPAVNYEVIALLGRSAIGSQRRRLRTG